MQPQSSSTAGRGAALLEQFAGLSVLAQWHVSGGGTGEGGESVPGSSYTHDRSHVFLMCGARCLILNYVRVMFAQQSIK